MLIILISGIASAQPDEKRVALLIGNSAYQHAGPLPNPRNDAKDMAATLRDLGFDVIEGLDLDRRGMDTHLARFARQAEDADVALVFYAGHGLQYEGKNYLVPVDAKLEDEISIRFETTPLDSLMTAFVRVKGIRLLVLDACRNNPLAGKLAESESGVAEGFAKISSPRGMLVANATQSNEVAYDGGGRNSFFSGALVSEIKAPGIEVHELFRRVAIRVKEQTDGAQLPEITSSLSTEFFFNRGETDQQAWARLRDSLNAEDLRAFIAAYPESFLVDAANARIQLIERTLREQDLQQQLARLQDQQRGARTSAAAEAETARVAEADARRRSEAAARQEAEAARSRAEQADRLQAESERRRAEEAASMKTEADRLAVEAARLKAEAEQLAAEKAALEKARKQVAVLPPVTGAPESTDARGAGAGDAASEPVALIRSVQSELQRVGCYKGPVDGNVGRATRAALTRYASVIGEPAPDLITADLVRKLQAIETRLCAATRSETAEAPAQSTSPVINPPAQAPSCEDVLERAQLGEFTDDDRALLLQTCR